LHWRINGYQKYLKERRRMEELRLVKPTIELKDAYLEMLQEWKNTGENMVPWVLKFDTTDFELMIKKLEDYSRGIGLNEGQVEHSTYWLVNGNDRVLGAVNIRHRLNESLLKTGGNIGYGVRPGDRRKGYASKMLALALDITREMGLSKALVTCDEDNIGSERTIINNGGIFDSSEIEGESNIVKRYWIYLK
jgi:predicted acetyltransferase